MKRDKRPGPRVGGERGAVGRLPLAAAWEMGYGGGEEAGRCVEVPFLKCPHSPAFMKCLLCSGHRSRPQSRQSSPRLGGPRPGPEALQDLSGPRYGSRRKRDSKGRPTVQGAQGTEGPQGAWDAGVPWGHKQEDCLGGPERGQSYPKMKEDGVKESTTALRGQGPGQRVWSISICKVPPRQGAP